jgi:serine protein kinase
MHEVIYKMNIFNTLKNDVRTTSTNVNFTLEEYLNLCKTDKLAYAFASERILHAIGEPEIIDTSKDPRLSRIFLNRTIKTYPAFKDFYGMEDAIERIVSYFKHSSQGLEEKKQILYLLGPVGSAKSSLSEKLKELVEKHPIYVLTFINKDGSHEISPVFETPLGLFDVKHAASLEKEYNIGKRYFTGLLSPWGVKRLDSVNGDLDRFCVTKLYPSKLRQIAVTKTEPGDDNNQDISALVGKTDIRMLNKFGQNDPDAYSFSGALCRGNQGLVEMVELFKAPIKTLHPLLTATQEGNYVGTEAISAIPFNGVILAHSNESEWQTFKNNKNNEAFLDRICVVKVPYSLRVTEELEIYNKMLGSSDLKNALCAPETLKMLSKFCVLTRLKEHENSNLFSKLRVYDGENIRETDPRAKSIQEYRDDAGVDEGMSGISTRFAFKVLSATFNYDPEEVAADPVHLMLTLENAIKREQFSQELEEKYIDYIKGFLAKEYLEFISNEIRVAYLDAYDDFGQSLFDRYLDYADAWIDDLDFKDPDTGVMYDRSYLNEELEKIEKPAGIANPKDFRGEVVKFVLRQRAKEKNVSWKSYEKLKVVIEKKMFASTSELLPIISFGNKSSKADEKKHQEFVGRMMERGYSSRQVRRLVDFYLRSAKS